MSIKSDVAFVVLYSTNIPRTHDFFKALGAPIQQLEKDKVVVAFGSQELHYILDTSEPFQDYKYITMPQNFGQGIIFYAETDDIASVEETVTRSGGVVKSPIFENLWNCKELLFEDPDGYKFAVYQQK